MASRRRKPKRKRRRTGSCSVTLFCATVLFCCGFAFVLYRFLSCIVCLGVVLRLARVQADVVDAEGGAEKQDQHEYGNVRFRVSAGFCLIVTYALL